MGARHDLRMPMILPRGFRFSPTDWELIKYLECKVMGEPLPCDHAIWDDIDIYDPKYHPETLVKRYGDDENVVYVFTKLKKVAPKGKNVGRRVGGCTWRANNAGEEVKVAGKAEEGWAKTFSFENEKKKRIGYIMKQYTLHDSILKNARGDMKDYALCRIYKKSNSKEDEANLEDDNSQDDQEEGVDANCDHHNQVPHDPEHDIQVKEKTLESVPRLISFETSWNHQSTVNNLHAALQRGDEIQNDFSNPASNALKLDGIAIHNTEQQQQLFDHLTDEELDSVMNFLEQNNDDDHRHDILSSQQDLFPPNDFDHQALAAQGFSDFSYPPQNQLSQLPPLRIEFQRDSNRAMLEASNISALQDHHDQYVMGCSFCNQVEMGSQNAIMSPSYSATLMRLDEPKPVYQDLGTLLGMTENFTHSQFLGTINKEEMSVTREDCSEFGWEIAKRLRSSKRDKISIH
ncbi:OLC1v1007989C1 [Oldenlandia corymbosa var. corymbosa]|uniref:OLC1v1007989C1 n=1 Tax=Oldenlandia corymbosa var. corymbosa TaxID=529605 RepID=A0AAV1DM16_OLDCO|nr:OLC1v1007989C1 [Oldenlandia corymbosa var. corymbosa]